MSLNSPVDKYAMFNGILIPRGEARIQQRLQRFADAQSIVLTLVVQIADSGKESTKRDFTAHHGTVGTLWLVDHPTKTRKNRIKHRLNGPASISTNSTEWFMAGYHHRTDGPAVMYAEGGKVWYLWGIQVESYKELQKLTDCDDGAILLYKLKYGKM